MPPGSNTSPEDRAAAQASWAANPSIPQPAGDEGLVLVLDSLRGLGAVRHRLRAFLADGCGGMAPGDGEDAVERAVLVIDELASNALRHCRQPSSLSVVDEARQWLVVVTDAAPENLPVLAVGCPAGAGGYGLYVSADLTAPHGPRRGGPQAGLGVAGQAHGLAPVRRRRR